MAGFGKRGLPKAPAAVKAKKPVPQRSDDRLTDRPPPRIHTGGTLHWSRYIALSEGFAAEVPQVSGVYALLSGQRESDVVFLGGTKDLHDEFLKEVANQAALNRPHGKYFCFAETPAPYEQADREIQIHRRRFGRKPLLNSGF